jgi:membrane protease YdiL (CAAX protease family)
VRWRIAGRQLCALATGAVASTLLGRSLSSRAGTREFYALTLGVAGTWLGGGLVAGHVPLANEQTRRNSIRDLLVVPVAVGSGMFGLFYLAALAARRVPELDRALTNVLHYADEGSSPLVLSTTLANAIGEEVFFRGAVYAAAEPQRAIVASTLAYVAGTTATRNPALIVASAVMGTVFAVQRRNTGGVLAPTVTHLTWAALMLRFLPPLFRHRQKVTHQP